MTATLILLTLTPELGAAGEQPRDLRATITAARIAMQNCDVKALFELSDPNTRTNVAEEMLIQAEDRCKSGTDQNAKMSVLAMQIAEKREPRYEQDGVIAVFDLSGMQLPKRYEVLRTILVDGRWYLTR